MMKIGGLSLVERAVSAARLSGEIDHVIVSTDDDEIANAGRAASAAIVKRPDSLASDTATSESALLHAISSASLPCDPHDVIVFIQCTSPFINPALLAAAVRRVRRGDCDVIFSAVASHGFLWAFNSDGILDGVNHEAATRLRRQERAPEYLETGAFYVMAASGFVERGHRFFGRVELQEVSESEAIEIDSPDDLAFARALSRRHDPLPAPSLGSVRLLVTDFDGVHTDNRAIVDEHGTESIQVSRGDGMGIAIARQAGIDVLILSTEVNPVVRRRAEKLGVDCEAGHSDKLTVLKRWAEARNINASEIAYIGNDVNDLACLEWVGEPIVVADAHQSVASYGFRTTSLSGGQGAVREVVDWLLGNTVASI